MRRRPALLALLVTGTAVLGTAVPAQAATGPTDGYDVSYPQAGKPLPQIPGVLAVVGLTSGVNDGTDATRNPDLARQLAWAAPAARVEVYVNTQHPDPAKAAWWPSSNTTRAGVAAPRTHGTCLAAAPASAACAYVYGWSVASGDVTAPLDGVVPALWWLDVEGVLGGTGGAKGNDWSASRTRNRAVLEGMADRLTRAGQLVGLYSTRAQLADVAGTIPATSPLHALPSWLPAGSTRASALHRCTSIPLADARTLLTQWTEATTGLDHDVVCARYTLSPKPRITGTKAVGRVATASLGSWSDAPHLAVRWTRDGKPIAGATARTHRYVAKDAGHLVRAVVTATRDGWSRTVRVSAGARPHR